MVSCHFGCERAVLFLPYSWQLQASWVRCPGVLCWPPVDTLASDVGTLNVL